MEITQRHCFIRRLEILCLLLYSRTWLVWELSNMAKEGHTQPVPTSNLHFFPLLLTAGSTVVAEAPVLVLVAADSGGWSFTSAGWAQGQRQHWFNHSSIINTKLCQIVLVSCLPILCCSSAFIQHQNICSFGLNNLCGFIYKRFRCRGGLDDASVFCSGVAAALAWCVVCVCQPFSW